MPQRLSAADQRGWNRKVRAQLIVPIVRAILGKHGSLLTFARPVKDWTIA
jgi:hypothetical protein